MTHTVDAHAQAFTELRLMLTGVAYRILGRWADAEDVVQDAWLRWSRVDADEVRDPRAFLVRTVSRLAIDRLRRVQAQHETYVGPWLPEPVRTGPELDERVELRESISMAMLVVLESLSPLERAVFVLREAFDLPFSEIAEIVDRAEPAVRQLARRARGHVDERRPRFEVDPGTHREVTQRFVDLGMSGDLEGLMALLAPDVTMISDGGGKVSAARVPVVGPEHVARFLLGIRDRVATLRVEWQEINGQPGFVGYDGAQAVWAYAISIVEGRIVGVYGVGNPDKLERLEERTVE